MAAMVRVAFTSAAQFPFGSDRRASSRGRTGPAPGAEQDHLGEKIDLDGILGRLLRAKERGGDREGRGRIAQRPSRLVQASQRDHPAGDGVQIVHWIGAPPSWPGRRPPGT